MRSVRPIAKVTVARPAGPTDRLPSVNDLLSRRSLLLAGGAAVTAAALSVGVTGCEAVATDTTATPAPIEALIPVLLGQQQLLATYAQTVSAFPDLGPALSDLQAQSAAHTDALLAAVPAAAAQVAAESSSEPSGSAGPSSAPPVSPPPPDAVTAQADLARAVSAAADALRAAALGAAGELAALLGSCAASTACHSRLLGL